MSSSRTAVRLAVTCLLAGAALSMAHGDVARASCVETVLATTVSDSCTGVGVSTVVAGPDPTVTVRGAKGGNVGGMYSASGGAGESRSAQLSLQEGTALTVQVGGRGGDGQHGSYYPTCPGTGGGGGGAGAGAVGVGGPGGTGAADEYCSRIGGAGGGASSRVSSGTTPLLVAGGGGGACPDNVPSYVGGSMHPGNPGGYAFGWNLYGAGGQQYMSTTSGQDGTAGSNGSSFAGGGGGGGYTAGSGGWAENGYADCFGGGGGIGYTTAGIVAGTASQTNGGNPNADGSVTLSWSKDQSEFLQMTCAPSVGVSSASHCTVQFAQVLGVGIVGGPTPFDPPAPTGTVSFSSSGTGTATSCTVTAYTCTTDYVPTAVGSGSHAITASYSGDRVYTPGSATTSVAVTKATAGMALACVPAVSAVGRVSTCTATGSGTNPQPTGAVSFTKDTGATGSLGAQSCTLSAGKCSVSYVPSAVASGSHQLRASYAGDDNYSAAPDATATVTVGRRTPAVSMSCAPASLTVGVTTTCTATAADVDSGTPSVPSGTVTFTKDASALGDLGASSCTLSAQSQCSVSYTPTAVGSGNHTINVGYSGDAVFTGAAGTTTRPVARRSSSTSVGCDPAAAVGVAVTCTATVADSDAGTATRPAGTVNFTVPGSHGSLSSPSCDLPATGAVACSVTYTAAEVADGTHAMGIAYDGDATHAASSTSGAVPVTKGASSVDVTCSPAAVVIDGPTTCTAIISAPGARPTGPVGFSSDAPGAFGSGGSCTLATTGATACSLTYTPSQAAGGPHHVSAVYAGDANHAAADGAYALPVARSVSNVALSCGSALVGDQATCTATVAGAGATPTGSVSFASDGPGTFGAPTCTLLGGQTNQCSVSYTPTALGSGSHDITATYSGDDHHATSTAHAPVRVSAPPAPQAPPPPPSATTTQPVPSSTQQPAVSKAARLMLIRAPAAKGSGIVFTVTCRDASCIALTDLTVTQGKKKTTVGAARNGLPAGTTKTITVALNAAGRRLLARAKRLHVTLTLRQAGSSARVAHATLTLKAKTPKK